MSSSTSSLFETKDTWRVPISDQIESAVKFGVVREGHLCVIGGNVIHLHLTTPPSGNVPMPTVVFRFGDVIDVVAWSGSGYIVAGDRNGHLHYICPKSETVLFSQAFAVNFDESRPIFADVQFLDDDELLALTTNGTLTIFRNLLSLDLQSVKKDGNIALELQNKVQLTQIDLSNLHSDTFSILPLDVGPVKGFITTGYGSQGLCLWQKVKDEKEQYSFHDSISYCRMKVTRCELTSCGKYLITLNDCGGIGVWLFSSLILVSSWSESDQLVRDFCTFKRSCAELFTTTANHSSVSGNNEVDGLCFITGGSHGGQDSPNCQTTLKLVTLPDFQVIYSLDVSQFTQLFHGDISENNVYYLDSSSSSSLQVKQLVQSLPENRLSMLLAQHKFVEAENFAIEFNIDCELVFKSKARLLNDQLSSYSKVYAEVSETASLTLCLDRIMDEQFILDLVFMFSYEGFEVTLQMLQYVNKKLKDAALLMEVTSALNKLTTHQMILALRGSQFSSQSWVSFLKSSILDELKYYLQMGDIQSACCLQNRHIGSLVQELDKDNIYLVLGCVPETLDSVQLGRWISRYVVPLILQHLPEALNDLLQWSMERIKILELTEKESWPGNGLHLVNVVLDSISSFKNPSIRMAIQPHTINLTECNDHGISTLSGLKSLRSSLSDLVYLHSSLQCPVSLSEYENEPHETIVYRLLDRVVAAELVVTTVKSKVVPFVQRYNLSLDNVLLNYIKLFLSQSPWYSGSMGGSLHEAKAIALIQAIQDKELYITGCVKLLKYVHTTWSEEVEEMVQQCMKSDHPMVSILRKQYSLLQLKKLLHGYEIRDFNFSDSGRGWIYVRKILSSFRVTALKDALEVAEMYQLQESDVYKHYLVSLIQQDKIEEATNLLKSLPVKLLVTVANKALSLSACKLRFLFDPELDNGMEHKSAVRLVLVCLRALEKLSKEGDVESWSGLLGEEWLDITAAIKLYKQLLVLQEDYSLYLSPQELGDEQRCKELLAERIKVFVGEQTCERELLPVPGSSSSITTHHDLYRFSSLLGFREETVTHALVSHYAQEGMFENVKTLCKDVITYTTNASSAVLLLSVIQEFWTWMEINSKRVTEENMRFIRSIASYSASLCSESLLLDAVEVYNLCTFLSSLHSQCTDSEIETRPTRFTDTSFTHWTWDHRYQEDGLVLDKEAILPLAARYTFCRTPNVVRASSESDSVMTLGTQLSTLLEDNSHTQLTLRCAINTLSSSNQHVIITSPFDTKPLSSQISVEQSAISHLLNTLATKMLSSRRVDHDYCLSMLLMSPPSDVIPQLMATKPLSSTNYSRVIALCKLSIDYSLIMDEGAIRDKSLAVLRSAEWGKKLSIYKVSYTRAFRGGMKERKKVGAALLRNKDIDLKSVIQYCCEELGQDMQLVLLTYLRVILTEWEEQYQDRAAAVMTCISDKTKIRDMFFTLVQSRVLPYDYERISFLLLFLQRESSSSSISVKVEQGLLILDCLRHYKRISAPSDYEKEFFSIIWSKKHPQSEQTVASNVDLPESASNRLPFHPLLSGVPMKIIGPELSISTVTKLATIARILKLPMDNFYSTSIKNIVSSSDSKTLNFDNLSPLLNKIQDKSYSLLVARWLAEQFSGDQDRTSALMTALSFAKRCKEQAKTESELNSTEETVGLCTTMLSLKQTEYLLQQHQLDQPKYLNFTDPSQLVVQLYTDVPVLCSSGHGPPIHSIAGKIASLFGINLNKVQEELYESWILSFGTLKKDMNATQVSLLEDPTEELSGQDEDKLTMQRLVYLLSVPDKLESNCIMLLNWAKRTSSQGCCQSRVRALQVLFAIATPDLIETITAKSIKVIKDFMQSALFVCELEALHMSSSISAFQSCSKDGLVKTLWRNHSHEPKAVRLTCELCLCYGVGSGDLWTCMLERLLELAMLPYLRYILKKLASKPPNIDVPTVCTIWQKTLISPLETMSTPLSPFQREECDESLAMIYECPFSFELDVEQLIQHFNRLELRVHALSCVLIIPTQTKQEKYSNMILATVDPLKYIELFHQVNMEMTFGGQQVKELMYLHLDQNGLHEALLNSEHFTDFVKFLVSKKRINGILMKSLELGRHDEAVQLVEMYNQQHCHTHSSTGKAALKEYLSSQSNCQQLFYQ